MALEKTNRINALFEFYEPLLTPKQTEYTALYYRDDFSLGEIASEFGVSRQAVYDNIKRTAALLEAYEDKLHLYQTFAKQDAQLSALIDYAKQTYPKDHQLASMLAGLLSLEDSE